MKFEGIYTPVITPFCLDDSIDWTGYEQVLEWQIENGIHGIVIGGSTGEFYALSKQQRIEQFKFAKKCVGDRAHLMAGVNDIRLSQSLEIAIAAKDAGMDSLLCAAPPYSLPSERELALHILKIDRAANLPIMLYNYPGRTGVNMGEEFLARIGQSSNICAIKESSGDTSRIRLLAREYPQIQLVVGGEEQVLEFYAWGAKAWICASANIFPKECVSFHEICAMGNDFVKGRRLMSAFLPVMSALESGGDFLQRVKYAAELQGRPGGKVAAPLHPMRKEVEREMTQIITNARITINKIIND